ncbi:POTRA domain-containing protein [Janthinobacterium sp. 551a]
MQNAIIARGYVTTRVLAEPQDLSRGNPCSE